MCGIIGVIAQRDSLPSNKYKNLIKNLLILSESRGKEASGFASIKSDQIIFHKTPFSSSELIKSKEFNNYFDQYEKTNNQFFATIGHSRLVTNGYEHFNINNQPFIKKGVCAVHNGIIVNQASLWSNLKYEEKTSDLDTELIPTIIGDCLSKNNLLKSAINNLYGSIYGMTSIALLFESYNNLLLATNNGSIYYTANKNNSIFIFASERYILRELIAKYNFKNNFNKDGIKQLLPRTSLLLDLNDNHYDIENIDSSSEFNVVNKPTNTRTFTEIKNENSKIKPFINTSLEHGDITVSEEFLKTYEERKDRISKLKRCKKCILPETVPFIEFDDKGICNYCNNYKKIEYKGSAELEKHVRKFKDNNSEHDCLIPFSGGRDSSYALHFVKKELGMKPLAYSYDWGMLTDLARRNQARMCDKLGVEHILVSADIRKKRKNIQKNVSAWLKRPNLGTIPLFMAGDKQYFYYANLLMKQNSLNLSILGENFLETTNFKSGFCGIKPNFNKGHTYSLRTADKLKMLKFYGKEYLLNPSFINSSIWDTLDAFRSYYVIEHQNINLFNYIKWDEKVITKILLEEYDWETDPDTQTTWRIGDGTAAFYNYIYYMVAGFTENDTFRSNQIREIDLTREKALKKCIEENKPRWNSIKWYLNTIRLEHNTVIHKINKINPIYD